MPLAVYVLGIGIFALTTSEYMVSGLMPALSQEFDVSLAAVGYLVTAYAGAMAIGGPLLTVGLLKLARKNALLLLIGVFFVGQIVGASASTYGVMLAARVITGIAAAAFFGVAITACVELVGQKLFGRASSIVLAGLMVGTVLGLPAATFVGDHFGWRVSFISVAVVALVAGFLIVTLMPTSPPPGMASLRSELAVFKRGKLWAIYTTSLLIIGSTFAAFTYFVPILTNIVGFTSATVPVLLVIYGVATIVGNLVVGQFADRFTIAVLVMGFAALIVAMVAFATFTHVPAVAVTALIVIGLAGVSMNPALVTRGSRVSGNSMLVNSVHTAFIMLGVMVGSWIGGIGIDAGLGLRAPLWVGGGLALLGLLTLVPEFRWSSRPQSESVTDETGETAAIGA